MGEKGRGSGNRDSRYYFYRRGNTDGNKGGDKPAMKITVNRYNCLCCLNCQNIFTPETGRVELDHNGLPVPEMPTMPQLAYNGWEIRRKLSAGEIMLLRDAVLECPGQALEFEE